MRHAEADVCSGAAPEPRPESWMCCVACPPSKPADHTAWSVQAASIERCQQWLRCAVHACRPGIAGAAAHHASWLLLSCRPRQPSTIQSNGIVVICQGGGHKQRGAHHSRRVSSSHAAGLGTSRQQLLLSTLLSTSKSHSPHPALGTVLPPCCCPLTRSTHSRH